MLTTKQQKSMRSITAALGVSKLIISSNPTKNALGYYRHQPNAAAPCMIRITGRLYQGVTNYHGGRIVYINNPICTFLHELTHRLQHIEGAITYPSTTAQYAYNEIIAQMSAALILNDEETWKDTAGYINIYAPKVPASYMINLKSDLNKYTTILKALINKYSLDL
jgi:hypothetical protein